MEEQHDHSIKTKALSQKDLLSFPVVYWLAFIIIVILVCRSDGKKRIVNYEFTEGIVVDKLLLPPARRRYRDVEYSQWQYVAGNDTLLFVDHGLLARNKSIGTKRTVIYLKEKHDEAQVYTFLFWINFPKLLIAFLIAFFIFVISQFARHWSDEQWFRRFGR